MCTALHPVAHGAAAIAALTAAPGALGPLALAAGIALAACLVAAGVVDARTRRLPHALALALAASAALWTLAAHGIAALALNALAAALALVALTAFELAWRRVRGAAGQGMGDVKALAALMLADPACALAAYALALAALAAACVATRQRSLPLLPFLAGAFALLGAVALACG